MTDWYSRPAARSWRCPPAPSDVQEFHTGLPSYAPSALTGLPALAAELGVGRVFVKDESSRLGLPAFKILGASYATYRALVSRFGAAGSVDSLREVVAGQAELVTATDGNHGRAVGRMAALLGLTARVYVPAVTEPRVIAAIESEGAAVETVPDTYDAAVAAAASYASASPDRILIQDTAWPGYETVPAWIVDGYSTLFRELDTQLASSPGLVVVPAGVGSLAQATVVHYRSGSGAPAILAAEPDTAACVTESLAAGELVTVPTGATVMAGLNCGTPSTLAWPVLREGLDASVTVTDAAALQASDDLHRLGVSSGPSGSSTLAAARATLTNPARRAALAVTEATTVILINTEARPTP